jgi:hypothetical protein
LSERFTHTNLYGPDTSMEAGQACIDELRQKNEMDVADFKKKLEATYGDKVTNTLTPPQLCSIFFCVC